MKILVFVLALISLAQAAFGSPKPTSHPPDRVVTVTNVVTVTVTNEVLCPSSDLAITDYAIEKGHLYRFYTMSLGQDRAWTAWRTAGTVHGTSNHLARVVLPVASYRPTLWQLVDITNGFEKRALPALPVSCDEAVTYIGVSRRLIRVPDARP